MTAVFVIVAGLVALVTAAAWMLGPWLLVAVGVVLVVVGLFVDLDRVKEPQRAKRHSAAP